MQENGGKCQADLKWHRLTVYATRDTWHKLTVYATGDTCHRLTVYATKTIDFLVVLEFCVEVFAILSDSTCGVFRKVV